MFKISVSCLDKN